MTSTALVIGGRGFLGRRVCAALERIEGLQVTRAGRSGDVHMDLRDMRTFPAMDPYDVIVNCADSLVAPPDQAVLYALSRGLTFLETTGDARTIDRLIEKKKSWHVGADGGRAIIGLGLFPGLTNLLAAHVATAETHRLEIGVSIAPASGAGAGTSNLMAAAFDQPARAVVDGEQVTQPSLARGPTLAFGERRRRTVSVDLAEPAMIAASTGVPNVAAYLAPRPAVLYPLVRLSGVLRPRPGLLRRVFLAVVGGSLRLLRGLLLRWRRAPVELTAVADNARVITLRVRDGFGAAGDAIAAAVTLLGRRDLAPGLYLPDAAFELRETLEAMGVAPPDPVELAAPKKRAA